MAGTRYLIEGQSSRFVELDRIDDAVLIRLGFSNAALSPAEARGIAYGLLQRANEIDGRDDPDKRRRGRWTGDLRRVF